MEKSTVALDNLLEIQRSPLDKSDLGFQKGESSLHVGKNTKDEPNKPIANNTNNKSEIQGNKKHIQQLNSKQKDHHQKNKQNHHLIKQQNQQRKIKSHGAPTFIRSFYPRDDRDRFVKFQRNQSPFVPFVHNVERYNCHKFGHIATNCQRRTYSSNQQRFQQYQQPRRMSNRYTCDFYGYCYSCHLFGHKAIDYMSNHWRRHISCKVQIWFEQKKG